MRKISLLFSVIAIVAFTGCSGDDDGPRIPMSTLTVNTSGLEVLGNDYVYEGWIVVNGTPQSTGTFNDANASRTFSIPTEDLDIATAFVLSIEPKNDADPSPSETKILSGAFVGNSNAASLSIEDQFLGILTLQGKFILATPTDTTADNDESGVWFMDPPNAGLTNLPSLSTGWKYEGWVVVDGVAISTGKFSTATGNDESSFFSGNEPAPEFPGEDFLATGVPIDGVTFPIDLRNQTIVISIEPSPDNSTDPFLLKPLTANTGVGIGAGSVYTMVLNNASFPSGTATR